MLHNHFELGKAISLSRHLVDAEQIEQLSGSFPGHEK